MRTQLVVFCPHTFDDFQHIVFFRFRRIQCMHSKTVGNFLAARFGNFLHMRMNGNDEVFSFNTLGDHFTSFFNWHAHCHYTVGHLKPGFVKPGAWRCPGRRAGQVAVNKPRTHHTNLHVGGQFMAQNIAHTQYAMLAGRVNAQPPTDIAQ